MMKAIRLALKILAVAASAAIVQETAPIRAEDSPDPYASETKEQRDARMGWWRDAKFGMFIHWGVYAVPAGTYKGKKIAGIGEWIMNRGKIPVAEYKAFAPEFTASKYDPASWAALAKKAGMRYVVITSKHHDGFALFDTAVSDWDAVDAAGAKRDLIAPLAAACRKEGLKFGLYYSQAQDWTHPGGAKSGYKEGESWDEANKGDFDHYLKTIAGPQVKEILTKYKPDVLWWDTPAWMNDQRAGPLIRHLKLVPGIIHNNRLGGKYKGDTETPEQHIPATGYKDRDWEVCMTMNDTWGFKSYDENWKSVETLLHQLCDIVSKGGNFLLNVGPTAEGEIPAASIERLESVGKWMAVNHEAVYGTTASPFHRLPWGRCTKKVTPAGTTLYLHVFDWPDDGRLVVPGLRSPVASASLLADGTPVEAKSEVDGVVISVPIKAPDPVVSVVKVNVTGNLDVMPIALRPRADGRITLDLKYAEISNPGYGTHIKMESADGVPHLGNWSDARSWVQWTFEIGNPGKFRVLAEMALDEKTKFQWGVDNKLSPMEVDAGGGTGGFRKVELGIVKIDRGGVHALAVKPAAKEWKPLKLRAVVLESVE